MTFAAVDFRSRRTEADKWSASYQATQQFRKREGHLRVPRNRVERTVAEDQQVQLGAWVGNRHSRATTLSPERVEQLSAIEAVGVRAQPFAVGCEVARPNSSTPRCALIGGAGAPTLDAPEPGAWVQLVVEPLVNASMRRSMSRRVCSLLPCCTEWAMPPMRLGRVVRRLRSGGR